MNEMRLGQRIIGIARHRLSTDGDGVTTLVAFHGCPLRCRYCLNPQSLADDKSFRSYLPEELYAETRIDELYFIATNGGVTFGGGEPCLRPQFIRKFRELCGGGWQINLETSLNVPTANILYGTVVDAENDEPLIGAVICNLNSGKAFATDIDGKFAIPAEKGDSIEVKYIGYETTSFIFNGIASMSVEISLPMARTILGEVATVVGKGLPLGGIVTDIKDRPLNEVEISEYFDDTDGNTDYKSNGYLDETDSDGKLSVESVAVGSTIVFTKDGYQPYALRIKKNKDYSNLHIKLKRIKVK